jgi:hypothetical protein
MSYPGMTPLEQPPTAADRHWLWPVSIIVLALLLMLSLVGGAVLVLGQQRELRALERDLAATRAELEAVEEELAAARAGEPAPGVEEGTRNPLDELLDGLGGGGLGGALEGLDLGGLLEGFGGGGSGPGADVMACLAGAMDPGGPVRPIRGADAAAQVQEIAERVEEVRGLSFPDEVEAEFLDPAAFSAEVRAIFDEDYAPEAAELDERLLRALGAIPADLDLRAAFLDLIAGQAAGFYRPDTGEIVVSAEPGDRLSPAAQLTLAHELEHALSDERLGLPDPDASTDSDAARASLALVEGGATLAMQQFAARSLGLGAQLRLGFDPSIREAEAQLATFPHYLQRDLIFPYEDGVAFTCRIHAEGGWEAIDAAYAAPPTTSAQVLWPERWTAREEAATPEFSATPSGWEEERTTTMGAADLLWLFEAPGDDTAAALDDPAGRAAAWAGGSLRLLTQGEETAVGIALTQREGERDLCASVADWYSAAFRGASTEDGDERSWSGSRQDAVLACEGDEVRLGIGPDAAVARAAAG